MTITLSLSSEQEHRLRAGAAQQDAQVVREILRQAVDSTVEELLRVSARPAKSSALAAVLDSVANELRDAPVLPDAAVSRSGIYADHP